MSKGSAVLKTTWHASGSKKGEGEYLEGKPHGFWTFWWENGNKRSEGVFIQGKQDGRWRFWGENGRRTPRDFIFQNWTVIETPSSSTTENR